MVYLGNFNDPDRTATSSVSWLWTAPPTMWSCPSSSSTAPTTMCIVPTHTRPSLTGTSASDQSIKDFPDFPDCQHSLNPASLSNDEIINDCNDMFWFTDNVSTLISSMHPAFIVQFLTCQCSCSISGTLLILQISTLWSGKRSRTIFSPVSKLIWKLTSWKKIIKKFT